MSPPAPSPSFPELGLSAPLLDAVARAGFTRPTPIQALSLPPMLAGRDVVGHARTGSGKTAAFGLALLQGLDRTRLRPQALVLCPTRELADQVAAAIRTLACTLPDTRVLTLCGGRPLRDQRRSLEGGVHVIVGTPGRVDEHIRRETLALSALRFVVLDEADRMLDMGFLDEVSAVLSATPPRRRTWLFSATFPAEIRALTQRFQRDPVRLQAEVLPDDALLRQEVLICSRRERREILSDLLFERSPSGALIFCETRRDCDEVAEHLQASRIDALALHGALEQRDRDDVLVRFSNGSAVALVATNVAARGLDIEALGAVVNFELPPTPEVYIHRVGRTSRAGRAGVALSLVAGEREARRLTAIEALLGAPLSRAPRPPPADPAAVMAAPMRTLVILGGRKDRIRPGDVLGALTSAKAEAPLTGDQVGKIQLHDRRCYVAVDRDAAQRGLEILRRGRIKGQRLRALLLG